MKFGSVPVGESLGAIAAHGVRVDDLVLRKGDRIAASQIAAMQARGIGEIVVARLEPSDVGEDEGARRLAQALAGDNLRLDRPFTGRANLFATQNGVLLADADVVTDVNAVDEAVTLATLPAFRMVVEGEMVATVKIIPFAVAGTVLDAALAAARRPLTVAPFRPMRVGVVSTILPGLKPSVIGKTLQVLEDRLRHTPARIGSDVRVRHDETVLADALRSVAEASDLVIVYGASAITDRRDIVPAALMAAGGTIHRFGMPVDPGNLLLLGDWEGRPVIGAPGCARSPKENGFDWVLYRLLAGLAVTPADIRGLGLGGLLMEIVSRPQPRAGRRPMDSGD